MLRRRRREREREKERERKREFLNTYQKIDWEEWFNSEISRRIFAIYEFTQRCFC